MIEIDMSNHPGDVIDDAPARRTSLAARRRGVDDAADAEILQAVRDGDQRSFDILYRRHRPAVERLARRLARNRADADDIVSEVFAATLRATLAGRGPTDDAGPYLLRSVRNTATSFGTRGDGRRAKATPDDDLARLTPATEPIEHDDEVGEAFRDLPDRFRDVLWSTEIEGATPADLAGDGTDAGAGASLSHRARCALRRSYLSVSTRRRCTDPACRSARSSMPAVVLGDAAASTVARVDQHVISCGECAAVFDQMQLLAERMPSRSLLAVLLAFIRNVGGVTTSLVGGAAPIIVVPAAVVTLTAGAIVANDVVADGDTNAPDPTEQAIDPPDPSPGLDFEVPGEPDPSAPTPGAEPSATSPATAAVPVPADPTPNNDEGTGAKSADPARTTPIDPTPGIGGVDATALPPAETGDGSVVPPSVDPTGELDDGVDDTVAASGALGSTVDGLDDVVDDLGETVDETVATLADEVDAVLEPVTGAVDATVDELVTTLESVTEPVIDVLEPVVEPVLEPVVEPVLEPIVAVVDEVGGAVLGTDTVVPTTLPAVPSTNELVDDTTDLVVDVTDGVTDLVGGLLGR